MEQTIAPPIGLEVQNFSAATARIYDTITDPASWPEALHAIQELTGASNAIFHWVNLPGFSVFEAHQIGLGPVLAQAVRARWADWAQQVNAAQWVPGKVYYLGDILPREELEACRYYREVLKPNRQVDFIGMMPFIAPARAASLAVNADEDAGMFGPRAIELMQLLAPHITKAISIGDTLNLRGAQTHVLASSLDMLACGVVLTNRRRRVVFANRAAQQFSKTGEWTRLGNNHFKLADEKANTELDVALAEIDNSTPPDVIVTDDERPLILTIVPLQSGLRRALPADHDATVAILIQDYKATPHIPSAALSQLFNLTAMETKVALVLAKGIPAADAAQALGIAESTIRSHIKRLLDKAGVARQQDFMALMMRAAGIVDV